MRTASTKLDTLREQLRAAERRYRREPDSVAILAVSKAKSVEDIRELASAGQVDFGENYLQETLTKQTALADFELAWHYIGQIQSNKTPDIARHFSWVHSVDRLKIAQRLSQQRPDGLPPLQLCLQVNLQNEPGKAGVSTTALAQLAHSVTELPRVRLRGLMVIPRPNNNFTEQRAVFGGLRVLLEELNAEGLELDTLSMGMSADWEAAVAEGATWIRIGTALFGPRE